MYRDSWKAFATIVASVAIFAVVDGAFRANSEKALVFFGAFTAAIVAAVAVIISTYLQAELKRNQEAENRRIDILAEAVELHAWLSMLADQMQIVSMNLEVDLKHNPEGPVLVAEMRKNVKTDMRERLRARLIGAARIPQPMGSQIVTVLHQADSALDTVAFQYRLDGSFPMPAEQVRQFAKIAMYWSKSVRFQRARLGQFLKKEGFLSGLDLFDTRALAEGHPINPFDEADGSKL